MDLLRLKYFQVVAKLEHMTKAAHALKIAQPALSMTIARLEADLGVPLFNRAGRNIVLNEYGKVFLERVNHALNELEAGRQAIADLSGSERGYLYVASTSMCNHFCDLLGSFARLYPKVNFHLTQTTDENTKLRLLESEEVDFTFTIKTFDQSGIVSNPLVEIDMLLAVACGHDLANRCTVSLRELAGEGFISLKGDHSIQKFCHTICQKSGFVPQVIYTCDSTQALINLVAAGFGIAFFPSPSKQRPNLPFVLIKVEDFDYKSYLYLAWKENRYFSKAAVQFREHVIQRSRAKNRWL
ncbi:LysR family transcriptional regulator|uniref:DNA-binding transcriptional regulator, LysR family n=1 Tax=Dendrosporobacter quercicolus TaxID=146817 RepID=A0A1G9NET1_9FIRM|nr:LysR family transcriptional regulator [Dendrosporobacter quercicolus]NSL47318.1 LysR family transcriptional regulator [Dendrosporobacter quercicolus DSM 1736]SDL85046.1 DNA-binding transcriptional regulator, LysR family [Dendrosporobacter quercicolus]